MSCFLKRLPPGIAPPKIVLFFSLSFPNSPPPGVVDAPKIPLLSVFVWKMDDLLLPEKIFGFSDKFWKRSLTFFFSDFT